MENLVLKGLKTAMCNNKIGFVFPVNGDCLNERDGKTVQNGIVIKAKVKAEEGHEIYICNQKAEFVNGLYTAEVCVNGYKNTIVAKDVTENTECKIFVFMLNDPVGKFRVSSDDNILFLQDITRNKDKYKSIFENPYLAVYKKAHDLYGAKAHINLFYEFVPTDDFSKDEHREYFNLSMMTDKFKEEFEANSDWLKLAFHAKTEYPDMPYKNATAEQITEDCIKVCREILRFAGEKSMNDTTTVHWGEANRECVRALRSLGFKSLTGYLTRNPDGTPLVSYYLDGEILDYISQRDFWYDESEDMMFGRIDVVLNLNSFDWVMDEVKSIVAHPGRSGFVSVMIHEQYFYDDYKGYLPDFEERVLAPCKYLYENGYVGSHVSDIVTEKHLTENKLFK